MRKWTPKEIAKLRETYKLTRKALGELLGGVTVTAIYQWERGLRTPSKIAAFFLSRIEEDLKKEKKGGEKRSAKKKA